MFMISPNKPLMRSAIRLPALPSGLFRITHVHGQENLISIGAGTLVTTAGLHGVLTADHVVAELRSDEPLGMIADYTGKVSRLRFEPQHLQVDRIARGSDDSRGPDLGFIRLAQNDIGMLKAQKTFFNIDKRTQRFFAFIHRQAGGLLVLQRLGRRVRNLTAAKTRVFVNQRLPKGLCRGLRKSPRVSRGGVRLSGNRRSRHLEEPPTANQLWWHERRRCLASSNATRTRQLHHRSRSRSCPV